jgi:hypothetical protein
MASLEDLGIQAASLLVSAMSGGRRAFRVPQRHIWRAAPRRRRTRPGCRGRDRATPRRAGPTSDCSAPSRAPARSDAIAPTLAGGAGPGCPPGAGRLTGAGPRGRRSGEMSTVLQYSRVRVGASGRPPADGSTLSADGSLSSVTSEPAALVKACVGLSGPCPACGTCAERPAIATARHKETSCSGSPPSMSRRPAGDNAARRRARARRPASGWRPSRAPTRTAKASSKGASSCSS